MKNIVKMLAVLVLVLILGGALLALFDVDSLPSVDIDGSVIGGEGSLDGEGSGTGDGVKDCNHLNNFKEEYEQYPSDNVLHFTSHLLSMICYDCGERFVDKQPVSHTKGSCACGYVCEHDYIGGICKYCDRPCVHSAYTPGFQYDTCVDCGETKKIFYIMSDDSSTAQYTVSVGTTWSDLISERNDFTTGSISGVVFWNGFPLIREDGTTLLTTHTIGHKDTYSPCKHSSEEITDYKILVGENIDLIHNVHYKCSTCGYTHSNFALHDYIDGVCEKCKHQCQHLDKDSETIPLKCETCSYPFTLIYLYVSESRFLLSAAPAGGYWRSVVNRGELSFFADEDGKVWYNAYVDPETRDPQPVKDATGKQVTVYDKVTENGKYTAYECQHLNTTFSTKTGYEVCDACGEELIVFWVWPTLSDKDSKKYIVPQGTTWEDMIADYEEFCTGTYENGVYYYDTLLIREDNKPLLTTFGMLTGVNYNCCRHETVVVTGYDICEGDNANIAHKLHRQCSICKMTNTSLSLHSYSDSVCSKCNWACEHPLSDGIYDQCEACGYEWYWFTVDGLALPFVEEMTYGDLIGWLPLFSTSDGLYMTYKGKALKYDDGNEVKATDVINAREALDAEHTYGEDGICIDCGAQCPHGLHYERGDCSTCCVLTEHEYVNGICKICFKEE